MTRIPVAAALVLVALAAGGCSHFVVHFTPYEHPQGPVVRTAVWMYPGDIDDVEAHGGIYLGTLVAETRRVSEGDRIEGIVVEAARYGGTHVVQVDEATHSRVLATRTVVSRSGTHTVMDSSRHRQRFDEATYDVFYVPPSRWSELPAALQP